MKNDIINLTNTAVNIAEVKTSLSGKNKKLYLEFLQTLQDRGILYAEDLTTLESAYHIKDQADRTLKLIGKLEKSFNATYDSEDLIELDKALNRNRGLYSKLIGQYHQITKDYFITPKSKMKAVSTLKPEEPKTGNPIIEAIQ